MARFERYIGAAKGAGSMFVGGTFGGHEQHLETSPKATVALGYFVSQPARKNERFIAESNYVTT